MEAENTALKGAIRTTGTTDSLDISSAKDQIDEIRAEAHNLRAEIRAERKYQRQLA